MLGSADAAEDAVQDAFVRAFDQLAQCKEPDNFLGWFFLILRNRRFAERRRSRATAPLEAADSVAAADRTDGGAEKAERRRGRRAVNACGGRHRRCPRPAALVGSLR